jgi:hypothetical protein
MAWAVYELGWPLVGIDLVSNDHGLIIDWPWPALAMSWPYFVLSMG